MSDVGTVKINRKSNFVSSVRKWDMLLDGKKIGNIANGKELSFEVAPGRHTIQVKMFSIPKSLEIDLSPNSSMELECGISPEYFKRSLPVAVLIFLLIGLFFVGYFHNLPLAIFVFIAFTVVLPIAGGYPYLKRLDGNRPGR